MQNKTPKENYAEYLQTDYWQSVSSEVKKRAGYRCQVCNSPHDLIAHHRTYEHRGRELEFLNDLICLCRRCHNIFHGVAQPAAEQPKPRMIRITDQNYFMLKCTKEPWHWMRSIGINPRQKGWARRAIGYEVPASYMR